MGPVLAVAPEYAHAIAVASGDEPEAVLPIRDYVRDRRSFELNDLKVMGDALTAALAKLGLNDRKDAMVEMVARRIVIAAMHGERDPIKLTEIGAGGRD